MTAKDGPGFRSRPARAGQVSAEFVELLGKYGASPGLLRRLRDRVEAVLPRLERNLSPGADSELPSRQHDSSVSPWFAVGPHRAILAGSFAKSAPVRAIDHDVEFILGRGAAGSGKPIDSRYMEDWADFAKGLNDVRVRLRNLGVSLRELERFDDDVEFVAKAVKAVGGPAGYSRAMPGSGSQPQKIASNASDLIRWSTERDFSRLPDPAKGEMWPGSGSVAIMERIVANFSETLGRQHLGTLSALRLLAQAQGEAGDVSGAIEVLNRLVADLSSTLGPDHAETRHARESLARWEQVEEAAQGASQAP